MRAASEPSSDTRDIDNGGILCRPEARCSMCGGTGDVLHDDVIDRIFGAPGPWRVRRCTAADCGLGWVDPVPRPDQVGKLSQSYYTPEPDAAAPDAGDNGTEAVSAARWMSQGWKKTARRVLKRALPWWRLRIDADLMYFGDRAPGRALEIGCGNGKHLRVLKAAGWDAVGIDFDEKAVAAAVSQGVDARIGDVQSFAFPAGSFDTVYMDNVVEHIRDHRTLLAECHRILARRGRIVMITPNLDALGHGIFGQDWRGLEVPRHLLLYSQTSLGRALREAGFGHVEVFPKLNAGWPAQFIVEQSRLIADRSGRDAPAADGFAMDREASRNRWFGKPRTEWIIAVAER